MALARRLGAVAFATCVAAPELSAQARIDLTPHFGLYLPFGTLVEELRPDGEVALRQRQLGGLMAGARIRIGGRPAGLEATFGYSPGLVAVTDPNSTTDVAANVAMGSLRALFRMQHPVPKGEWSFHVAPGIGIITRYGEAWTGTEGATDGALVLAGGGELGLSQVPITLRVELEDYITLPDFDHGTLQQRTTSRVHHDMVWSFGVVIALGGRSVVN